MKELNGTDDLQNRFTAYLQASINNTRVRYLKEKRERELHESAELDANIGLPDTGMDVDEALLLLDAMKSIQAKERKIVYLRAVQQKSFAEISDALGMKLSSVTMMYYRTVDKLRSLMSNDEN